MRMKKGCQKISYIYEGSVSPLWRRVQLPVRVWTSKDSLHFVQLGLAIPDISLRQIRAIIIAVSNITKIQRVFISPYPFMKTFFRALILYSNLRYGQAYLHRQHCLREKLARPPNGLLVQHYLASQRSVDASLLGRAPHISADRHNFWASS